MEKPRGIVQLSGSRFDAVGPSIVRNTKLKRERIFVMIMLVLDQYRLAPRDQTGILVEPLACGGAR